MIHLKKIAPAAIWVSEMNSDMRAARPWLSSMMRMKKEPESIQSGPGFFSFHSVSAEGEADASAAESAAGSVPSEASVLML